MWIATDASTGISLRVHQRVTLLFRWDGAQLRCFHIHISNPYEEMQEGDVGFPLQMARQSCLYLEEQIALQKEKIARQTAQLERLSYHDGLTGAFNRNKYNQLLEQHWDQSLSSLGVGCFDLNGLKQTNDALGHSAGDVLIQQMAARLEAQFPGQVYRIGRDEFLVLDSLRDRQAFQAAVPVGMEGQAFCVLYQPEPEEEALQAQLAALQAAYGDSLVSYPSGQDA